MYYHNNHRNNNRKPNHRTRIESCASQSILYEIIEQQIRNMKYRNKDLPTHVNQLPQNHFLHELLNQERISHKYKNLEPFISPNDLMKVYNRRYAKDKFIAVEIYYYFDPKLNNKEFQDESDPQDFFFAVKNWAKQFRPTHIQKGIETLMSVYLNKNKKILNNTASFQSSYVVPNGYYPLISMKIKYDFYLDGEKRTGFQYLLLRYDEHKKFKIDLLSKITVQQKRKKQLFENINRKKNLKAMNKQPQQIKKKQQLKTIYKILNVSFGWIEVEETQFEKKQRFQSYFDILTVQDNIRYASHRKNPNFTTTTYLFFKKGQFQIPRIQIISFLFEQLVFKCVIKLSDIKKVSFFNSEDLREIYLHVNSNPQFFFHMLNKNVAFNLYTLNPWQRIQNFPIDFQKNLSSSIFMRNYLSQNSVICIDFSQTNKKQFDKVVRFFSAQQILNSQFMYEKPYDESNDISENPTLNKEAIFNSIMKDVKGQKRILVHHIKFSLLSLKALQKSKVQFEDLINLLQQLQNKNLQILQKHNDALKLLCLKPHQLLSKPFKEVYPKFLKKQEIYEKLSQKFPNMELYQIVKLQEAFQMDSLSQISDIGQLSDISEVQNDFLKDFFATIQRTRIVYIPRIKLTPNGVVYNGWSKEVASKILKHYRKNEYQFLKCQICDDQGKKIFNCAYIFETYIRKMMDKIKVLNLQYIPLGWSQSQLKQGALWYTLQSNESNKDIDIKTRDQILAFMGDFNDQKNDKLKNPALKAARIGQNFGSSWSFDASQIKFQQQEDIYVENNPKKNFSDGIGCISEYNMLKFRESLGLDSLAAVQIRYKGVKGVLSLNKQLPDNTAILRKSQIKYQASHPESVKYFDIIDFSKYKVGYLNRQIIILLIANKVQQYQILSLQTQYIKRLQKDILDILFQNISYDEEEENLFQNQVDKKFQSVTEVFKMILSKTYQQKNNQVNKIIFDLNFFKALKIEAKRKLLSKLRQKSKIRVDKSVRLFGILDQFRVLGEYQVYCSILKNSQSQKINITGKCLLTKNPCMHPADIRVVTCVSDKQIQKRLRQKGKNPYLFEELVNVIIFPQQGKTPLTLQISNSDLDGDQFFLSWDQRIVPYKNLDPFIITQQVPFIERNWEGSGYKQMLDFYMEYQNFVKLGRLSNNHLIHADLKDAFCKECIELCNIHSVAVQYPKRGYDFKVNEELFYHMYPHFMEKQHPQRSYVSTSIVGKLYDAVLKESNLKGYNFKTILEGKKQRFWQFIQVYVNKNQIKELKAKSNKRIEVNKIIQKYEQNLKEVQDADEQITQKEQNQEPVSYANVKSQLQVESKQLYKKKKLPFVKQDLDRLIRFMQLSQLSKKYDMNQPFSLSEILLTFNYLSIFYYEIKQLSELLENEHQTVYTVYFQLQTSSKNKNNLFIIQRLNQLRMKWLKFFGEELVSEGCYSNIEEFLTFYFNKLIQKDLEAQDSKKKFQKLREFAKKKSLVKKMMNEMNQKKENDQKKSEFILEEIQNLKIIKKSLQYEKYSYSQLKDLNPLIYRKMVLFYVVSNYFRQIVELYNIKSLINNDKLFFSDQEGKRIRQFLEVQRKEKPNLKEALKFYDENQIEYMGFSWFCMPKLMVVWWRQIFLQQEAKLAEKKQVKQVEKQIQKLYVQTTKLQETVNKPLTNNFFASNKPENIKPFEKKPPVYEKTNYTELIDVKKCEIY